MTNEAILSQLGISKNAVKIYTASLKYGSSLVHDLAQETGLVRQLVYEAINELINRGLMIKEPAGKNRFRYVPNPPKALLDIVHDQEKNVSQLLPDLESLYKVSKSLPKIRIYENNSACRQMLRDLLKLYNKDSETQVISATDVWYRLNPDFIEEFWDQKAKTGVKTKLLSINDGSARYLANQENYEVRKLPRGFDFQGDMAIFGDVVTIMSVDKYDIHAVWLESKQIAKMHTDLFYGIWNKAKSLIK